MDDYVSLIPEAYRKVFQDNKKSLHFLRMLRFGSWFICPKCRDSIKIASSQFGKQHWCPRCHYRFYDFSGTFLDNNKLPWSKVILGTHLFILGKPARRAAEYLKTNYKSIRTLFHNIRLAIYFYYAIKRSEERVFYNPKDKRFYLRPGFARYLTGKLESYRHIAPDNKVLYLKEQEFRYNKAGKPGALIDLLGYLLKDATISK